jgi:predicted phosphodiesterase
LTKTMIKVVALTGIILVILFSSGKSIGEVSEKTAVDPSNFENYKFIFLGDTRPEEGDNTGWETLSSMINTLKLDHQIEFILHSGDVVWDGSVQAEWDTYWWPNAGPIAAEIPFYYAVGNHEYDYGAQVAKNLDTFKANVDNPGNEIYYSFNTAQNDTHIIVLNTYHFLDTEYNNFQNLTAAAEQQAWLEQDLATNNISRIIAVTHTPFWNLNPSSDRYGAVEEVRNTYDALFVEHGVDLVISGHAHNFYNTYRNGTYYTTSGGGTADFSSILIAGPVEDTVLPEDVMFTGDYHLCLVETTVDGYDVSVITPNMSYVYNYSVSALLDGVSTTELTSMPTTTTTSSSEVMVTTTTSDTTPSTSPSFTILNLVLFIPVMGIIYRKRGKR